MTPQALVPSIGRNVSSATIQRGMSLPKHFRKLVNLCRLGKKQRFFRLGAKFHACGRVHSVISPQGLLRRNKLPGHAPRPALLIGLMRPMRWGIAFNLKNARLDSIGQRLAGVASAAANNPIVRSCNPDNHS
jgi:hypothetical protein